MLGEARKLLDVSQIYLLEAGIAQRLALRVPQVSPEEVRSYYDAHRDRYVRVGKGLGQVLFVQTGAQAAATASLLRRGWSARQIARREGSGAWLPDGDRSTIA